MATLRHIILGSLRILLKAYWPRTVHWIDYLEHTHAHTHARARTHTHTHSHARTHAHTHTHTHIHTHTHAQPMPSTGRFVEFSCLCIEMEYSLWTWYIFVSHSRTTKAYLCHWYQQHALAIFCTVFPVSLATTPTWSMIMHKYRPAWCFRLQQRLRTPSAWL